MPEGIKVIFKKKLKPQKTPIEINGNIVPVAHTITSGNPTMEERIKELEARPHRNPILHWIAFAFSLVSFILLSIWVFSSRGAVPSTWVIFDIVLGVVTAVEIFTRSGFKWGRAGYLETRFFDFVAIIPALALVHHGLALEGVWVWVILVARFARTIDRLVGDGFIRRNIWALIEGFEEEITDRVLQRIVGRILADMDRAHFGHEVAGAFVRNRDRFWRA